MVADVLCEFLEVAVHLILYVREVYPVGIFQKRKKYNVPVQVSLHAAAWATGSSPNPKVGRGWMVNPPPTPQRPGLAFRSPAHPTASCPSCLDFSFHPLGPGSSPCPS